MFELRCGDAFQILASMQSESVQCVMTSPPYWGLRDYKTEGQIGLEKTPEEYVAALVAVFREVRRVLRKDGTLWLNMGDTYHSGNRGGYRNDSHRWEKSPLQSQRTGSHMEAVSPNRLPQRGLKDKDLVGIPWRVAFALQADRWWLRSDIIWSKPNPMPESVTDRPTRSHEYIFLFSKSANYYYDSDSIAEPQKTPMDTKANQSFGAAGGKAEAVYGAKVSDDCWEPNGKRNRRTVWEIATQPFPGAHFATMPEALVEPCILAGSRPGDLILDPFCGAGTVVVVALHHERRFVGIDLNADYVEMARARIVGKEPLFRQSAGS